MVKTIRVSEEYHEWLHAHKGDDETMEETLRRMTRGPHPSDVADLLTEEKPTRQRRPWIAFASVTVSKPPDTPPNDDIDSSYLFDLMAEDPDAFSKGAEFVAEGEMQSPDPGDR